MCWGCTKSKHQATAAVAVAVAVVVVAAVVVAVLVVVLVVVIVVVVVAVAFWQCVGTLRVFQQQASPTATTFAALSAVPGFMPTY